MERLIRWYGRRAKYKCVVFVLFCLGLIGASSWCDSDLHRCAHSGSCVNERCVCQPGWQGTLCQQCGGRVRLTEPYGLITDGASNYSVDMQCSWLIDSGQRNATIRLQLLDFETECSWDHLYIFDGDSIFSELVAAFSGVLMRSDWNNTATKIPEIITHSGSAYLYFYSDVAFNMSGFNISYSINGCPNNCSEHGVCVDGACTCNGDWTGSDCGVAICANDCHHGYCDRERHKCICRDGFKGRDCSLEEDEPVWELESEATNSFGRAIHQMLVLDDQLWIVGGENFHQNDYLNVLKYNFTSKKWKTLDFSRMTVNRYGHSLVVYQNKLFSYGGMLSNGSVMNDLWTFDPDANNWDQIQESSSRNQDCQPELCSPVSAVGHTANVVNDRMIVIFGHNPVYGYLNTVQQYDFVPGKWKLVSTRGAIVKGGYGHTSVYDKNTQVIYVYGGYHSSGAEASLVDYLYCYQPWEYTWKLLTPSDSPRYLHSSVILNGMMLVFGGNTINGTTYSGTEKCFSADFQAYHIEADTWLPLKYSGPFKHELARFGHSSVVYKGSVYVFGGFNGVMLKDLIKFTPGKCKKFLTRDACFEATPGVKCTWDFERSICVSSANTSTRPVYYNRKSGSSESVNVTSLCSRLNSCPSCIENTYGCVWCGGSCSHGRCSINPPSTLLSQDCEETYASNCDKLHNCHVCHTEYHCGWQADSKCYTFARVIVAENRTEKVKATDEYRVRCDVPCNHHSTCENCTGGPCMWCSSQNRCVEANAYVAVFPIAQCLEWTTQPNKCPNLSCREIQSCSQCQYNPRCGWCDDGSGTGLGVCMEGAGSGPVVPVGSTFKVKQGLCPLDRWFFTSCPECQCNGHSVCLNGTSLCQEPCNHLTEGSLCERCIPGYYGNPTNGGNCTQCFCNHHGDLCNSTTGYCHCNAKGIIGNHCDRCDEPNQYIGNPKEIGGSCFYNLSVDFQYTFNMSKPDDIYFSQINFMNAPPKPDVDVDFSISCSKSALINISMASALSSERILHENRKCGSFKLRFSHNELTFGLENTTFYVYIFDFEPPIILQISFSQHRTLDLLQFFITFSSCFLSLLVIAAILWKVKQKYDLYRRRQRLFVEMEQMASRPFSGVAVDLEAYCVKERVGEGGGGHSQGENRKKITPNPPTPIALEPCSGGRAAVLTLIIRLSNGGEEYTPGGQSALAMGSTLVSLGPLSRNNDIIKDDSKFEVLKISNNTTGGTCI